MKWHFGLFFPKHFLTLYSLSFHLLQTGLIKHKGNNQTDDSLTTCAWHPDSQRFVAAGTRGHFYQIVSAVLVVLEAF